MRVQRACVVRALCGTLGQTSRRAQPHCIPRKTCVSDLKGPGYTHTHCTRTYARVLTCVRVLTRGGRKGACVRVGGRRGTNPSVVRCSPRIFLLRFFLLSFCVARLLLVKRSQRFAMAPARRSPARQQKIKKSAFST